MRKTVAECYEAYIADLTEYREWMDKTAQGYRQPHPQTIWWSDNDYKKANRWNAALSLVRQVLDLTDAEDAEADRRAGIKKW